VVRVDIGLLGGFTVGIDGVALPAGRWHRRHAAALVKLLALSPRARLHRDRVIDALWPEVGPDTALPRLHKAAHYARQGWPVGSGVGRATAGSGGRGRISPRLPSRLSSIEVSSPQM